MSVVILCFNLGFYMVRFFEIMTSIKYVIKDMIFFLSVCRQHMLCLLYAKLKCCSVSD